MVSEESKTLIILLYVDQNGYFNYSYRCLKAPRGLSTAGFDPPPDIVSVLYTYTLRDPPVKIFSTAYTNSTITSQGCTPCYFFHMGDLSTGIAEICIAK